MDLAVFGPNGLQMGLEFIYFWLYPAMPAFLPGVWFWFACASDLRPCFGDGEYFSQFLGSDVEKFPICV